MTLDQHRIILASKSPRRTQLLTMAGLSYVQRTKEVEENYPADLAVEEVPLFLARKKATACMEFIEGPTDVILAADSVVILDNVIYGKPKDYADAKRILRQLSGTEHRVITGVCLKNKTKELVFGDTAFVQIADLSDAEIEFYIDNYKPFDKAGAYAIQEWIGLCKIISIKGTYANIMGLPVNRVYEALAEW